MASPLQIVLNPNNFSEDRDKPGGGGPKTDFFLDDDIGFVAHRQNVLKQLADVTAGLQRQAPAFGPVGFVKVILRRKAWAKSHRPLHALFSERRTRLVGNLDLGELIVEATPQALTEIAAEVARAEDHTQRRFNERTKKLEAVPTPRRSETGAIESVELYGAGDRRQFDLDQAVVWLSNPKTGGQYEVELFEIPPVPANYDIAGFRRQLFESFTAGLQHLGTGLDVHALPRRVGGEQPTYAVRLEQSAQPPIVRMLPSVGERGREIAPFDPNRDRHARLVKFLESHPLVKKIELPGVVVRSEGVVRTRPQTATIQKRDRAKAWPRVGVIDGGISDAALGDWVVGRWDPLAAQDMDHGHGTFIGGILVAGSAMNGPQTSTDADGVELYDIAVYPNSDNAFATYYRDLTGFLDEVENAVAEAKAQHGVRVFNFSMNVQVLVSAGHYSKVASRLDHIADTHDVLIFISAGNLNASAGRPEWPATPDMALQLMAASQNDGIHVPAESARNVSVGALNPAGLGAHSVDHAPARYSRRGPGLRALVKPDFAFTGGSGTPMQPLGHGLYSVGPNGSLADGCGTSYATPFIAKQAAILDSEIEGDVSRETLVALLTHHAQTPLPLSDKTLNAIARQLCGHGITAPVASVLEGGDHQITLVFATRLEKDRQMNFRFSWPSCLVGPGNACRGSARLTLVSSPPLDQRFGAEFTRINVEAALQQEQISRGGEVSWKGQLKPLYLPPSGIEHPYEAERVEHGMKWSPVKTSGATMPKGRGASTNWRLVVSYLSRTDNEEMPDEGVPFTAILTISDPKMEQPVFQVMRQQLLQSVQIADIRTAARVVSRV